MSGWDPKANEWEVGGEDVWSTPPGFTEPPGFSDPARAWELPQQPQPPRRNLPTSRPSIGESQWDLPPQVVNEPVIPRNPEPQKPVIKPDWHESVFPEPRQPRGKFRNEHAESYPERREALPSMDSLSISEPRDLRYHGDIRNRMRETVTIARRAYPQEMVTNEHGTEEFHSEDIPMDPSLLKTESPYKAEVAWEGLGVPDALLTVVRRNNFLYPSKVQAHGIKLLLEHREENVLVQAPTGSGKTLTFILGTLASIDLGDPLPQIICVAPTNELLVQLTQEFTAYSQAVGVTVSHLSKSNRNVSSQVLLMTPAQCINLFRLRGSQRSELSHMKFLILDEADHLLNQDDQPEFFANMETVIKEFLPVSTRVLLFSATFSDPVIAHIRSVLEKGYLEIMVKKEELVLDNIKMYYIQKVDRQGKIDLLISILREQVPGVTVVFVNTVKFAQMLLEILQERGYKCALLIGRNMTTDERFRTLEDFKRGFYTILLTTNVLARGIDNTHVARVINYDIPTHWSTKLVDAETYLHRVGRTGRFNRPGIAVSIVTTTDELHMLEEVKGYYGTTCVIEKIETDEEMREKVKQFAEEIALLDCEA